MDGGADLILIETIFDTLNAKAAIFACEEVFAKLRPSAADDDLRHDHRPLGPHPFGPDADRVLALGAPRAPAHHRPQLRARRRARCASIWRRSPASPTRWSAPIPTPACPTRSANMTRAPRRWRRRSAPSRAAGLVNVVGGCCGSTPAHIRAIAEAVRGLTPRSASRGRAADAALGPGAVHAHARHSVRQCRRAHQRHRLRQIPQARSRRATTPARSSVARDQVANGAQIIDVNMDEGLDRLRRPRWSSSSTSSPPSPTSRACR